MTSRKSPRTLERQLNQLIANAEERRALMRMRRNGNRTARRSFERYSANVPLGRTRRRSSSRVYREPLEIIEVPAMKRRSSSDDDIAPSGVYLSRWNFYNDRPRVFRGDENSHKGSEEISRLIRNYHLQKRHK
jgi:hypothetical protein